MGLKLVAEKAMIVAVRQGEPYTNDEGRTFPAKTYCELKDLNDARAKPQELSLTDILPEQLEKALYLPIEFSCTVVIRTFERNTRIECRDVHIRLLGAGEPAIAMNTGEKIQPGGQQQKG